MQVISIAQATTAELVAFYNGFAETIGLKPVKKFADRATAEKRLVSFTDDLAGKNADFYELPAGYIPAPDEADERAVDSANLSTDPTTGADEAKEGSEAETGGEESKEEEAPEPVAPTVSHNAFATLVTAVEAANKAREESGEPLLKAVTGTKASNSEGVAASWVDADVRSARLERHEVVVTLDGKDVGHYKSTRDAFRANRLPDNKHIRFRLKLKEAHRDRNEGAIFEHNGKKYHFTLVVAPEPEAKPAKEKKAKK